MELNEIEQLQKRLGPDGEPIYRCNRYADRDEVLRKWQKQNHQFRSARYDKEKSIEALEELFKLVENVNRNILIKGLLERNFEKRIIEDNHGKRILYTNPWKKAYNTFDDGKLYRGFDPVYKGLTSLQLVVTPYDYFDEARNSFRNRKAHFTMTMFNDSYEKELKESYKKLGEIFQLLTEYLIIVGYLERSDVTKAVENNLVKVGCTLQDGNYEVIELISKRGGSSRVYLARQKRLNNRKVAIKEYRSDKADIREKIDKISLSERKNLAELSQGCWNIPNVVDAFYENGTIYTVMEYVDGINIEEFVKKHSPTYKQFVGLLTSLAQTLNYLHENKVVYNDLKADNILVTKEWKLYLIDFGTDGISSISPSFLQQTGGYQDDMYAFGYLLEKLLKKAKLPGSGTQYLKSIAEKCKSEDAYATMNELAEALGKNAIRENSFNRLKEFLDSPRKLKLFILVMLIVVFSCGGIGYLFFGKPHYLRQTEKDSVNFIIERCQRKEDDLNVWVVIVNRKREYIREGDIIEGKFVFERNGDKKEVLFSFSSNKLIGYNDVYTYKLLLRRDEFPDDYYADVFNLRYELQSVECNIAQVTD